MKTILAAIDLSPVTSRVVTAAVALARNLEARLVLLNVTTPASLVPDYAALEAVIAGADPDRRANDGPLRATAIHGESLQILGEPVEVILQQADRCSADYIIMGSHGHSTLFHLVVGGTAAGVIGCAKCPVIVIPPLKRTERWMRRTSLRRRDPVASLQRTARPRRASVRAIPGGGRPKPPAR